MAKYAGFTGLCQGLYTAKSFSALGSLSPVLLKALIQASNNSLATSTWRQYKTTRRHLERCQKETKVRMSFPMTRKQILTFIAYMIEIRKVQAATVSKTLSAVRTLHLIGQTIELPI